MHMYATLMVCLLVVTTLTSANITGQHPVTGTCLCVTSTNVEARMAPSTNTSVVGFVSGPECFAFYGAIQIAGVHEWYQLQNVRGYNAWVAGDRLKIGDSSQCTTTSYTGSHNCSDATAKDYACKLLALADAKAITLWMQHPSGFHDNAYAYNNIEDACQGHAVSRSNYTCAECRSPGAPGGDVCLKAVLLQYIYAVYQKLGYIHVNEIAGGCHSCKSYSYNGGAVDIHNLSGQTTTLLSVCESMGGRGQNNGDHVHCQFT